MQTLDNSIRLRPIEKRFGRGVRLQTEQDPDNPNPTYIEAANDAARRLADKVGRGPELDLRSAREHPGDCPSRRSSHREGLPRGGDRPRRVRFRPREHARNGRVGDPANPGVN